MNVDKLKGIIVNDTQIKYTESINELNFLALDNIINSNPDSFYKPRTAIFYTRDAVEHQRETVILDQQKAMLNNIKKILTEDKTDYKIVISPLYDQKKINIRDMEFLKTTFGADKVFDFSGKNKFTDDFHNYYEASHYRKSVAKAIIDSIYK